MTIKILSILKRADDQEQFFEFNALNREAFNLYNLDREQYVKKLVDSI
jgi:hypothetical protein